MTTHTQNYQWLESQPTRSDWQLSWDWPVSSGRGWDQPVSPLSPLTLRPRLRLPGPASCNWRHRSQLRARTQWCVVCRGGGGAPRHPAIQSGEARRDTGWSQQWGRTTSHHQTIITSSEISIKFACRAMKKNGRDRHRQSIDNDELYFSRYCVL